MIYQVKKRICAIYIFICTQLASFQAFALNPPSAPKISGLTQGDSNWINVLTVIVAEVGNLGALSVTAFISLAGLIGLGVAICLELFTERGSGKQIAFAGAILAIGLTTSAYLVQDLLTLLGKS
ncbi:hypothetical protein A1QO_00590 [Vibrio genomosp. F10 str. ZF-129]|uniref:Integrating conjugative element membrane protein n=1 Tax=Vibrio genomosp. F10 str. ZF-129 TaxID=1187848 RepID=A0A1E5BG83_9VIBR|nr:hypothetical protein [Vibrio genomosp. F10]OEE35289.1 hypothetical protein A1QO_00590 [Vibrio genomosp. F10 str. ZF-129]